MRGKKGILSTNMVELAVAVAIILALAVVFAMIASPGFRSSIFGGL